MEKRRVPSSVLYLPHHANVQVSQHDWAPDMLQPTGYTMEDSALTLYFSNTACNRPEPGLVPSFEFIFENAQKDIMNGLESQIKADSASHGAENQTGDNYDHAISNVVLSVPYEAAEGAVSLTLDNLPNQWGNPQWEDSIDLETPSLETVTAAGLSWNNPTSSHTLSMATSESAIPELPRPPSVFSLQESLPHHPRPLRSEPAKKDVHAQTRAFSHVDTSMGLSVGQSSDIEESHVGLRTCPSAAAMMGTNMNLPEQPSIRDGQCEADSFRSAKKYSPSRSQKCGEEEAEEDIVDDERLKLSRERNRIAAAKTRMKKKTKAKEIEETAKIVEERNRELHQEVRKLRDAFSTLRYCALSHDPTSGCTCSDIHEYNEAMAKEVAKEVARGK